MQGMSNKQRRKLEAVGLGGKHAAEASDWSAKPEV